VPSKRPGIDIKEQYKITLMGGLVAALLLMVGLFRMPLQADQDYEIVMPEQEVVQMEEIQQTEQAEPPPPPPPRPQTVVAVSDDAVLEDVELDLDASLDVGEAVDELPPPPPPEEEEEEEEAAPEEEIFVVVEQMPELIGGLQSIQACIEYPEVALRAGLEGRVFVQFIVGKDGSVRDPEVVRGIGGGADEEAVRCIMQAKFEPGMQRGKPVPVRYVIPVNFRLRDAQK
jgi:protein TonB